jgi:lipid-A-disaccharide synthase
VLCLLPFETSFYGQHGVNAVFVGHPLADQFPLEPDRGAARRSLTLDETGLVIALLPGSRMGEVERLGADFIAAAEWIAQRRPGAQFLAPMTSAAVRSAFERQLAGSSAAPRVRVVDGMARAALAAADGVMVASGTATLETLLSKRPMVVAYRLGATTAFLLRRLGMVKVPYFSQPNLLLGRGEVPEFFQEAVTGASLGEALLREMEDPARVAHLQREFRQVHETLRRGGADKAAAVVLECAGVRT